MPMKDATLEKKLRKIVDEGKPKTVTVKGKRVYASKKSLKEIREQEKEGGIYRLIPIFAGLAAGGLATITNAVNSKKSKDAQLERKELMTLELSSYLKEKAYSYLSTRKVTVLVRVLMPLLKSQACRA